MGSDGRKIAEKPGTAQCVSYQQAMKNSLIVIVGPTGVGKTATSLLIAEHYGCSIINADSRQLYGALPVGTAAPTDAEKARVKHYFAGTLHLEEYYSASIFEQAVTALLTTGELKDSPVSVMTGGSMLYIDSVCNGIDDIPTIDDETRSLLKRKLAEEGLERLVDELRVLDPDYYSIVDRKNTRRVVHALEICYMTGRTYSSYRTEEKKERPFNIIKIGLTREREELYDRINRRVLKMIEEGFIDEVLRVYPYRHLNSLNTVGYKELFDYVDGLCTLENAVTRIQGNTRRYCRKQLTWFKRDPSITWFHPDETERIIAHIDSHLTT